MFYSAVSAVSAVLSPSAVCASTLSDTVSVSCSVFSAASSSSACSAAAAAAFAVILHEESL